MRRFEDLRDDFASADLILISLGGNDVLYFANEKVEAGHDWAADEFLQAFGCARIGGGSFGQSKHYGLIP